MSAVSESSANEVSNMNETDQSDSILDRVCIAMPCNIGWDNMKGNDEVRLCGGCNKNVYNISAMSKKRAEELLSQAELPCLHIVRNTDGTLVTDECPLWLRPLRNGWTKFVSVSVSLIALFNWQNSAGAEETKDSTSPVPTQRDMNMFQVEPTVIDGKPYSVSAPKVRSERWFENSFMQVWPAELSVISIDVKDLPQVDSTTVQKFKNKQVSAKHIEDNKLPHRLDRQSWVAFERARNQHAKACMFFLKHQMKECSDAAAEAMYGYDQAFKLAEQKSHDPLFRKFIIDEKNKAEDLLRECTSYFDCVKK